ncbi:protein obstructor-E [Rhipicephalus sanguineus]|uniref:protein obstructor-E n=1 Tax=Rhipicephalus sanguineus TaxID=34632 RepID=UPI001892F532|nr:protein obstructor-E [Rhipicephalus sanguineus]
MRCTGAICSLVLLLTCAGAEFQCPSNNGYFPDPEQCDMYYECRRGVATPKLCADGMAFHDGNPLYARCDFLGSVDCSRRPYLQNAKSTHKCPRANGFFPHEDYPRVCQEFYSCNNGVASKLSCQKGLAFSIKHEGCEWAARVPGCEHEAAEVAQKPSEDQAHSEEET